MFSQIKAQTLNIGVFRSALYPDPDGWVIPL